MDKEFIDGYVKLPYDNNKFIRWIDENELEMIEKKIIHISNEIIADESVDIIKYIEDKLKSETDHYKQQRDSLIKDVEKLREELKHLRIETDEYFMFWQEESRKYEILCQHIRLKALHNPSVSRYKDLMHFIDELEGGFNERN